MEFHVLHGLLLEIGQFDSAAKLLEGHGAGLGFEFVLDCLVDLAGQLRIVDCLGEDSLEHLQQLRFIRLF